ncbi:MAG: class I adenylate-forming enzyme family protein, partial [Pseudomonadota bacterium]
MADQAPSFPAMSIAQANALLSAPDAPFEMEEIEIRGVKFRSYKHAPPTLRDVLALSAAHVDKDMIVYEGERVTFTANLRAVAHLAEILRDQFGVEKGDRVAVIMRNYPQWPVAFFAALSIGAIATPMNSWWTGDELEYGLKDSGAKVAIVDSERVERLRGHLENLPDLEHVIIARCAEEQADPRMSSMEALIGDANSWAQLDAKPLPDTPLAADDDATIMYTSGTTGRPKGALASHRAIMANVFNAMACQARSFLRRGEQPPMPSPDDPQRVVLLSVPFFHATGAFAILAPSVLAGGRILTTYKWDATAALKLIEDEKVNVIGGVPAIAWQILEHPERDKYDLSSIEVVSYGGAPSAPELVSTIKRRFKDAAPGNGWGMTETCASATLNFGDDYILRPESAGASGPAMDLKTVDADGNTLPRGEIGEIWAKGTNVVTGYWRNPEATAATFEDGWVKTGDLGRLDEEGFLFILDRAKDMLIRGG